MIKKIVLAAGCFWVTDAVFRQIEGVNKVSCGYCGGKSDNPSFEAVALGSTEHAECALIEYEDKRLSLERLLEIYFTMHDPTEIDRQGPDIGTQYRSAIYYFNPEEKLVIEKIIQVTQKLFSKKIATTISLTEEKKFYIADYHHQNYYSKHFENIYCKAIIKPKLDKIKKIYGFKKSLLM
jgi:peptide-methionine (S)-S-oxide reductase